MTHSRVLLLVGLWLAGSVWGLDNSSPELLSNPNLVVHYTSKDNFDRMVAYHGRLDRQAVGNETADNGTVYWGWDTVFFHLYTPESDSPQVLFANNMTAQDLLDAGQELFTQRQLYCTESTCSRFALLRTLQVRTVHTAQLQIEGKTTPQSA